jgi:hypothetical protein
MAMEIFLLTYLKVHNIKIFIFNIFKKLFVHIVNKTSTFFICQTTPKRNTRHHSLGIRYCHTAGITRA